jgi:hypothetical protein
VCFNTTTLTGNASSLVAAERSEAALCALRAFAAQLPFLWLPLRLGVSAVVLVFLRVLRALRGSIFSS